VETAPSIAIGLFCMVYEWTRLERRPQSRSWGLPIMDPNAECKCEGRLELAASCCILGRCGKSRADLMDESQAAVRSTIAAGELFTLVPCVARSERRMRRCEYPHFVPQSETIVPLSFWARERGSVWSAYAVDFWGEFSRVSLLCSIGGGRCAELML
jgi:hypothetical protein